MGEKLQMCDRESPVINVEKRLDLLERSKRSDYLS